MQEWLRQVNVTLLTAPLAPPHHPFVHTYRQVTPAKISHIRQNERRTSCRTAYASCARMSDSRTTMYCSPSSCVRQRGTARLSNLVAAGTNEGKARGISSTNHCRLENLATIGPASPAQRRGPRLPLGAVRRSCTTLLHIPSILTLNPDPEYLLGVHGVAYAFNVYMNRSATRLQLHASACGASPRTLTPSTWST